MPQPLRGTDRLRLQLVSALALAIYPITAAASEYSVRDVDTVVVDGAPVRLQGVDGPELGTVRRKSSWNQELPKLRESSAHLVGLIMRGAGCDASCLTPPCRPNQNDLDKTILAISPAAPFEFRFTTSP